MKLQVRRGLVDGSPPGRTFKLRVRGSGGRRPPRNNVELVGAGAVSEGWGRRPPRINIDIRGAGGGVGRAAAFQENTDIKGAGGREGY